MLLTFGARQANKFQFWHFRYSARRGRRYHAVAAATAFHEILACGKSHHKPRYLHSGVPNSNCDPLAGGDCRFATTVASGAATIATKRTLELGSIKWTRCRWGNGPAVGSASR